MLKCIFYKTNPNKTETYLNEGQFLINRTKKETSKIMMKKRSNWNKHADLLGADFLALALI